LATTNVQIIPPRATLSQRIIALGVGSLSGVGWPPESVSSQAGNDLPDISILLEKANGGDSRRAGVAAPARIFECDSANGNRRDRYSTANFSQLC
jgi:hypothetical protein